MSVRDTVGLLKNSRGNEGATQEEFSNGICSSVTLSNIETGKNTIKTRTFEGLCKKVGRKEKIFPVFNSYDQYLITDCLSQIRRLISVGDSYGALTKFAEGVEYRDYNNKLKAEYLFLGGIYYRVFCGADDTGELYIKKSIELLGLAQRDIRDFTSVLEYEVYISDDYNALSVIKGGKVSYYLDCIESSQLTENEKKYLKMVAYASLTFAYDEAGDEKMSVKFAKLCQKYARESSNGYFMLYVYRKVYRSEEFLWGIRDIYDVFGCNRKPSEDEIKKLPGYIDKVIRKEHVSSDSQKKMTDILKYVCQTSDISNEQISYGLCDEGKLKNYQNGRNKITLLPLQCFFERAGASTDAFVFWGNKKEVIYNALREMDFKEIKYPDERLDYIISNTKEGLEKVLYNQIRMMFQADFTEDDEIRLSSLWMAIKKTCPNITAENICEYALSWTEIMILTDIGYVYLKLSRDDEAFKLFEQVLKYYKRRHFNISFAASAFPRAVMLYVLTLYKQKRYEDLIEFVNSKEYDVFMYDFDAVSTVLTCYSKSLHKLGRRNEFVDHLIEVINNSYHNSCDRMFEIVFGKDKE